jgi:hypothetical protein
LHNDRDPLLSQRSALILLLGVLVGIGAGTVAALGDADPATAVLTGASACGAGIIFFNAPSPRARPASERGRFFLVDGFGEVLADAGGSPPPPVPRTVIRKSTLTEADGRYTFTTGGAAGR